MSATMTAKFNAQVADTIHNSQRIKMTARLGLNVGIKNLPTPPRPLPREGYDSSVSNDGKKSPLSPPVESGDEKWR